MLIYWKKKALHKSHKRKHNQLVSQENSNSQIHSDNNHTSLTSTASSQPTVYIWFTLKKYDVEQLDAIQRIARQLGISPGDVTFAGIKDKRALTYQRGSVAIHPSRAQSYILKGRDNTSADELVLASQGLPGDNADTSARVTADEGEVPPRHPSTSAIPPRSAYNIAIDSAAESLLSLSEPLQPAATPAQTRHLPLVAGDISYGSRPIRTGELWGNQFRILLRSVQCTEASVCPLQVILERLRRTTLEYGVRFPNYFGSQRMGIIRDSAYISVSNQMVEESSQEMRAYDLPVGPHIGKCLLTGAFQAAVDRIILGDGCCQTVVMLMMKTDRIPPKDSILNHKFPLYCTSPLCGARQGYLGGESVKCVLSKVSG